MLTSDTSVEDVILMLPPKERQVVVELRNSLQEERNRNEEQQFLKNNKQSNQQGDKISVFVEKEEDDEQEDILKCESNLKSASGINPFNFSDGKFQELLKIMNDSQNTTTSYHNKITIVTLDFYSWLLLENYQVGVMF